MSYGLGRLQSLSAVLSRLSEARGYLEGQPADLEIVPEVDALAGSPGDRGAEVANLVRGLAT